MPRQVAILHGWSDDSDSFKPLVHFLERNGYETVSIFLGDYISLRDDVKIDDVAKRMEEVVREKMARPVGSRDRLNGSFDLIVHSTGGLVARRWVSMHYADTTCPVGSLIMLAPTNFGSKLAHLGRSMLGRIFKGWRTGFETGEEVLYALELASPFQWDLAQSDLFVPEGSAGRAAAFYGRDRVRVYVIVGTHPYTSLGTGITNESGSDGAVRVAAANMNARGMTVDFSGDPSHLMDPVVTRWRRRGGADEDFPLAVLPDRHHGNVIDPEDPGLSKVDLVQRQLGDLIVEALGTSAQDYAGVATRWRAVSMSTRVLAGDGPEAQQQRDSMFKKRGTPREYFHEYYQIVVQVEDEFGQAIPNYFLSFMPKPKTGWFSNLSPIEKAFVFFHEQVLEDAHEYRRATASRCFFLDRFDVMRSGGFYDQISGDRPKELNFTVTAADPGDRIAYFARGATAKRGVVKLHQEARPSGRWLTRHSTHFIRVIVPRAADPDVFKLKRG